MRKYEPFTFAPEFDPGVILNRPTSLVGAAGAPFATTPTSVLLASRPTSATLATRKRTCFMVNLVVGRGGGRVCSSRGSRRTPAQGPPGWTRTLVNKSDVSSRIYRSLRFYRL